MLLIPGSIRLGCVCCRRTDFDGISAVPSDWGDVDEVQSFEASRREIDLNDLNGEIVFWETHVGMCPDCQTEKAVDLAQLVARYYV